MLKTVIVLLAVAAIVSQVYAQFRPEDNRDPRRLSGRKHPMVSSLCGTQPCAFSVPKEDNSDDPVKNKRTS